MIVKELIDTCASGLPVIIGMTNYNSRGATYYTTARYTSPRIVTGPILSASVKQWYISDGHLMIEAKVG